MKINFYSALFGNNGFRFFAFAALLFAFAACKQAGDPPPPETWAVTVQYDQERGTASANPNPAEQGQTVTITAEAKNAYKFRAWQLVSGGVVLYSANTNPATFTMPGNEVTIRADFELLADIMLDDVIYGYEQPAKKSVAVAGLGINTQEVINITLGEDDESPFVLDEKDLKNKIIVGNVINFLVQPKTGLKAGTYADSVIVTHGNGKTAVFYMGITVKQKPLVISGIEAENKVYDGTRAVTFTGTAVISGVIEGDEVEFETKGAAFEDANAGEGKTVSLSGCTLSGADADNYALPQSGIKADISPKPILVVAGSSLRTLVPFGTTEVVAAERYRQNDTITLGVIGLIDGDTARVSVAANSYGLSGSVDTDGAGTLTVYYDGTAVAQTAPVNVSLSAAGNYQLSSAAINVRIRDGLTADRWLSLANANIEEFKVYANTANGLKSHYRLVEDITLNTPAAGGANWTAIGNNAAQFTGNFDGNRFVINNLSGSQGMFACIGAGGLVKNTALVGGVISGNDTVGGLAGVNNGTIENCYTTASVSGMAEIGGMAGVNNGAIKNCYTTGNVSGEGYLIGGVAGRNSGTMRYCYATGRISGGDRVGGVAGQVDADRELRNCVALNPIVTSRGGANFVDRVIGYYANNTMISNNYGRSSMDLRYNWNGSAGSKKTSNSSHTSSGGQSVTSAQFGRLSYWWISAANWNGGVWDITNIWYDGSYQHYFPGLRNAGGRQIHSLQLNLEMVPVPAGSFTMGSPASEGGNADERPQRTVTLSGFYMGKYPITQEQYGDVMASNPSYYKDSPATGEKQENRPVESITWINLITFCNMLSIAEGLTPAYRLFGSWGSITETTDPAVWLRSNPAVWEWDAIQIVSGSTGYRLPTEAQWEYACRARTSTAYNTGAAINTNTGWYSSNSGGITHEVGKKSANAWGLYDMHGNVAEFCWDWYGAYTGNNLRDPQGPSGGASRALRGGSYNSQPTSLRSAARSSYQPSSSSNMQFGFRVVRP
ncbi:MAG: SUMF1/EgtB/PvdO family nonheme iron enzyme [Treponema sp.]|jgi:formylglycine-generating enzyme required for sulfatase activity|nr:SUMF1/EgtB/PvdO family nonheme iron enzyme [Treponema sp.]